MADTGILSNNAKFPSHEWHFVAWPFTMTTLHRSDFIPNPDHITELDYLPNYERFPWNICNGCSMPTGDTYSSEHLVPSDLGLAYVLLVETNPFPELVIFPDYTLRTILILLHQRKIKMQRDTTKTPSHFSITQRLQTDLGGHLL